MADDKGVRVSLVEYVVLVDEDCPSRDEFQAGVIGILGHDPFEEATVPTVLGLEIRYHRDSNVLRSTLQLAGLEGSERQFLASTCQELGAAMALAVAIAVDPMAQASPEQPKNTNDTNTAEARDTVATIGAKSAKAVGNLIQNQSAQPPVQPGVHWSAYVSTMLVIGATPDWVGGLAIGAEVRHGSATLGLSVQSTTRGDRTLRTGSIQARLMTLGLLPCFVRKGFGGCVSANVGLLQAGGVRPLEEVRTVQRLYLSAGGRSLANVVQVGATSIDLFVDAQVALRKIRLFVSAEEAWATPRYLLSGGVTIRIKIL